MYSDSLAVYTAKSVRVSCMFVLITQTVLSYLRMDVNLTNRIESNLRQPNIISFHSSFTTAPDKKVTLPLLTSAVIQKKCDENLSGVIALRIQSIKILFRIHFYPDLCAI